MASPRGDVCSLGSVGGGLVAFYNLPRLAAYIMAAEAQPCGSVGRSAGRGVAVGTCVCNDGDVRE